MNFTNTPPIVAGDRVLVSTNLPQPAVFAGTVIAVARHHDGTSELYLYVRALGANSAFTRKALPPERHAHMVAGFDGWVPMSWCEKIIAAASVAADRGSVNEVARSDNEQEDDGGSDDEAKTNRRRRRSVSSRRSNRGSKSRSPEPDAIRPEEDDQQQPHEQQRQQVLSTALPFDLLGHDAQAQQLRLRSASRASSVASSDSGSRAASANVDSGGGRRAFISLARLNGESDDEDRDDEDDDEDKNGGREDDDPAGDGSSAAANTDARKGDAAELDGAATRRPRLAAAERDAEYPVSLVYLGFEMCKLIKTAWPAVLDAPPPPFVEASAAAGAVAGDGASDKVPSSDNNNNANNSNPSGALGRVHSIHLCHRCLTPLPKRSLLLNHYHVCTADDVPASASEIFKSATGDVSVFHINGAKEPEFAQRLAILGRSFIEAKDLWDTPLQDVEFYALYCSAQRLGMCESASPAGVGDSAAARLAGGVALSNGGGGGSGGGAEDAAAALAAKKRSENITGGSRSAESLGDRSFDPLWMPRRTRPVHAAAAAQAAAAAMTEYKEKLEQKHMERRTGADIGGSRRGSSDFATLSRLARAGEVAARNAAKPEPQPVYFAGFFSRVKRHPNQALSCIMLLPPFQGRGLGGLLVGLAYALDAVRKRDCGCEVCGGDEPGRVEQPWSHGGRMLMRAHFCERMRLGIRRALEEESRAELVADVRAAVTDNLFSSLFSSSSGGGGGGGGNQAQDKTKYPSLSSPASPTSTALREQGGMFADAFLRPRRQRTEDVSVGPAAPQKSNEGKTKSQGGRSPSVPKSSSDGRSPASADFATLSLGLRKESSGTPGFSRSPVRHYCLQELFRRGPQPWSVVAETLAPSMNPIDVFTLLKEDRMLAAFSVRAKTNSGGGGNANAATQANDVAVGVVFVPRDVLAKKSRQSQPPASVSTPSGKPDDAVAVEKRPQLIADFVQQERREFENPKHAFPGFVAHM